ncbi:hypothetical protein YPPY76_3966, partial [Yersinia pestis PY-76]
MADLYNPDSDREE